MDRPRVLMVVRPAEGGIRAHIQNLTQNLNSDFTFTVACSPESAAVFAKSGCDILPVPLGSGIHPANDLRTVKKLVATIHQEKFALIHAHGFKAGLVARIAGRLSGIPCLMTVHGEFAHGAPSRIGGVYSRAERFFGPWAVGYITVSRWLASELSRRYGISEKRIAVIPNGINPVLSAKNGPKRFVTESAQVATVARLAPQKGVEYFIRAAARINDRFPGVRFIVAGDGPLRAELEALSHKLRLEGQLSFLGYCADVPALLAEVDIFVLPSLSEGQGIAVLEAMAAGCPVVASATGGIMEIITHRENGLLAEPGSAKALAAGIAELLADPQQAEIMAAHAKNTTAAYDRAEMIEKTRDLYWSVLEGRWPE